MKNRIYGIYAVVGSLREKSYNAALMKAMAKAAPGDFNVITKPGIGDLPHFNPDIDDVEKPIESVRVFREALKKADCVIICSPEYAHNIPGVLKNALDWVVGSGELVDKAVVVVSASTSYLGGDKAHESLKYLVKVLSANLLEDASFNVDSAFHKFDENGSLKDPEIIQKLMNMFEIIKAGLSKQSA